MVVLMKASILKTRVQTITLTSSCQLLHGLPFFPFSTRTITAKKKALPDDLTLSVGAFFLSPFQNLSPHYVVGHQMLNLRPVMNI